VNLQKLEYWLLNSVEVRILVEGPAKVRLVVEKHAEWFY